MSEIIRLEHVYKSFEGIETLEVLEDVSLSVKTGQFISISGHSGIGKSTLLHIMGTLLKPTKGEIFYFDKNISSYSAAQLNELRAKKIASVFQEFSFIQALNLNDNLNFIYNLAHPEKKNRGQAKIDELLEILNLSERKFYLPQSLSGGQKRRAMIVSALIKEPHLLLCDEPTNDLDEEISNKVMELFQNFVKSGKSIVLVSHNKDITSGADIQYTIENKKLKPYSP